ncbi:MAG: DUF2769 domain-containing protein [Crenarchaeota archaeon]|nr:DUF2769 domain-containing protein [Thermoproteota archaeon]
MSNTLFCAHGKAEQNVQQNGCLCPNCPVWQKYSLDKMYYCIKGKSVDIES